MSYWILSAAIVVLGFLTGFSIGAFILPVGVALLVLGPIRHRPRLYWPALMAVVGYQVGFLLYAPLTCTSIGAVPGGALETVCTTILGPEYRGTGTYNPSLDPARLVGLAVALGAAALAFVVVWLRQSRSA